MRSRSLTAAALLTAALLGSPPAAFGDDAPAPASAAALTPAPVPASTTPDDATLAAALPMPSFSVVGKAKVGKNGTITLVVQATAAGKFTAFAEVPGTDAEAAATAARLPSQFADNGPMPLPFANFSATVAAGTPTPLYFRPGKAGKAAITRITAAKPLRVTIAVMFGLPGGALATTIYVVRVTAEQTAAARAAAKRAAAKRAAAKT